MREGRMPCSVDGRQTLLLRPAERARPTGLSASRRDRANVRTDFVAPCQHTGTAGGFQSLPPRSRCGFLAHGPGADARYRRRYLVS